LNRILEGAPDSGLDRTKVLTREQIERYAQDGYLFPVPALTRREADKARATLEAFEAGHGGAWPRHVHHKPHLLLTWVDGLVRHPAILDAVEDIVGPDILCWSSRFFLKNPHDGGFVSWHQDLPYWGLDMSEKVLTVWLALSPANRANGVMKVIPRSHNKLVLHKEAAANNLLRRGQEVAVEVDESQAVYMELGAGEISLHHGLIFHGSEENRSNERRIGFAIRYIPARISPLAGLPRDTATLVRGTDRYGHFDLLPPPLRDLDPGALEAQRKASAASDRIRDIAATRHMDMVKAKQA
jgi:non-heme Fe2+,alpha-ketoglutarate-dependent halogenase